MGRAGSWVVLGVSGAAALLISVNACRASGGQAAKTPTTASPATGARDGTGFVKPPDAELRQKLSREQYEVTQHEGTEMPYHNAYWDNHEAGIYVDVVSGEPLFSSLDKYDSKTGWPSFTRPLEPANLASRSDRKLLVSRTEVRSRLADSHLGHVFEDGPPPTGLRYCMNSAALRFVPADQLESEGYGKYAHLFKAGAPAVAGTGQTP